MTGLSPENIAVLRRFAEALAGIADHNDVMGAAVKWRHDHALPWGSVTPFGVAAANIIVAHMDRSRGEITASEAESIVERMLT